MVEQLNLGGDSVNGLNGKTVSELSPCLYFFSHIHVLKHFWLWDYVLRVSTMMMMDLHCIFLRLSFMFSGFDQSRCD